jgi:phytoene/squalene synthetase
MKFDDDLNACAAIVERGDPERFRAIMLTPVRARAVLFPIYAFNVEIARAPWVTKEPMIAHMRLQWWRDALEEIAANGIVRRHEVVTPLAHLLNSAQATLLIETVEARRWDIEKDPFENEDAFEEYIGATSGHLIFVTASLFGGIDEQIAYAFGFATGMARFLRAVSMLERAGRTPLIEESDAYVSQLAQKALEKLDWARQQRKAVSKFSGSAMICGNDAKFLLKKIKKDPKIMRDFQVNDYNFKRWFFEIQTILTGAW